MEWVYLLGFGLFPLTARAFAPLADRLASVAAAWRGSRGSWLTPRRSSAARRPTGVAAQRETAAQRLSGVAELGRQVAETERAAAQGTSTAPR